MNQVVSKESLDALANVALTTMQIEADDDATKAEYNLHEFGAAGALGKLLVERFIVESGDRFGEGVGEGFELGLAVAAAIQTNPLDLPGTCDAIEAALDYASQHWPEEYLKETAA
jgi:hypothetical protein